MMDPCKYLTAAHPKDPFSSVHGMGMEKSCSYDWKRFTMSLDVSTSPSSAASGIESTETELHSKPYYTPRASLPDDDNDLGQGANRCRRCFACW
jgi:hypothetical protein